MITDLPLIPTRKRISSMEILRGKGMAKIDILRVMSEDAFEEMVLEWAHEYLSKKYIKVKQQGGAGDKGRDVIGFYANGKTDIYQCKHYSSPLAPSDMYLEFGKLCYYTFNGDYDVPLNYYMVAPNGIGPKLQEMVENPELIKERLIKNWTEQCERRITKTGGGIVKLDGAFKKYVEDFDFSIIKGMEPLELIDEHAMTSHHAIRFGGGLVKARALVPKADLEIASNELIYTTQLLDVYSEKLKGMITTTEGLKTSSLEYFREFNQHRDSFYSAESLQKFSRDNFPDSDPTPFDELKTEALSVVNTNLAIEENQNGYFRLQTSIREVQRQYFSSNPLNVEITAVDKQGVCHHLANDNIVKWRK